MATLQQQVQQYLQNTGISLRELSRRSGVSRWTISSILKGGVYKSDTAHALYSLISITPISEYVTLHDKVEQLAAERVDHDKGWDVDLNCAKYRRVMQLEKELEQTKTEVDVWRDKAGQARKNAYALQNRLSDSADVLAQREQHLKSCENALIEAHEKIAKQDAWIEQEDGARNILQSNLRDAQDRIEYLKRLAGEDGQKIRERDSTILDLDARMDTARAEIKRLTALSDTHGQSWKAACVQVEQLQKQLDHGQAQFKSLHESYNQQVDDEAEMLAQIDTLFAERDNMRTEYEYGAVRLRVYCFALVFAIVFLIVSGLVVWGGV